MGSKTERRNLFGVVLSLAAIAVTGGWAGPAVAKAWGMYLVGASIVYSGANAAYAAKQAKKKAADAMAAALEDRKTMTYGGMIPKSYVYGMAWLSGVVVYVREAKDENDPFFWIVLALPIAHEITGIDYIYFGDAEVGPFDASGNPTGGEFVKYWKNTWTASGPVPQGNRIRVLGRPEERIEQGEITVTDVKCAIRRYAPASGGTATTGTDWYNNDVVTQTYQPPFVASPFGGDTGGTHVGIEDPNYYGNPLPDYPVDANGMPVMTTVDTWQDPVYTPASIRIYPNEPAYVIPGSGNEVYIPGNPGDEFTLTYSYTFARNHIRAWWYLGSQSQTANPDLMAASRAMPAANKWTEHHKLTGIPYVILRLRVNEDVFPHDLEQVTVVVRGKKVFDPRVGDTIYSSNPVLIARDYAIEACGVKPHEINQQLIIEHANACAEAVKLPFWAKYNYHPNYNANNKHDYRYRFHGMLSTDAEPINNLGVILASCDGSAVFSGTTLDIRCGKYDIPVQSLTEHDFAGAPEITVSPPRQDSFNGIRASFIDTEDSFWPLNETPILSSEFYQTVQDRGIPSYRDIELAGTPNIHMATRIAKQMLHRSRNSLTLKAQMKVYAYTLYPEQTVLLNLQSLGMVDKPFRVKSVRAIAPAMVEVVMQEDAPQLYDANYREGESADPTPNTILPNVRNVPPMYSVGAKSDQTVAVFGPGGDLSARMMVFWASVTDMLVLSGGNIEVEYKRTQDRTFQTSGPLPPTSRNFHFPIKHGEVWLIQVRCSNALVKGPWSPLITKYTNDAPTPYVTGNLLQNASLVWQVTNPPATGRDRAFKWDGWEYYATDGRTIPSVDTLVWYPTGDSVRPADHPYRSFNLHFGDDREDQEGYVRIPENCFFHTSMLPVEPGKRMVCYADIYAANCHIYLDIWYFDKGWNPVGMNHVAQPLWDPKWTVQFFPWPRDYVKTGLFTVVPADAAFVRIGFQTGAKIYPYSDLATDNSIPNQANGFFGRVYYGRASPGQVQYPPWAS